MAPLVGSTAWIVPPRGMRCHIRWLFASVSMDSRWYCPQETSTVMFRVSAGTANVRPSADGTSCGGDATWSSLVEPLASAAVAESKRDGETYDCRGASRPTR
jgi:hypothetical protein